jgi:hypothetical protein
MAIARFRKLCLDANDPDRLGPFLAQILNLTWEPDGKGEGGARRTDGRPVIWLNRVAEPKTVKHRVHFDMYARSLADLEALGSRILLPEGDDRMWTIMADLEDGEYCAFLRAELPAERLHGVVVDSADPFAQSRWWAQILGGTVVDSERGFSTVENVEGVWFTLDFVPVPEPKVGKNRIHLDLTVPDLEPLLEAGATVLRPRGGDIAWDVLADPEGNEFCAFAPDQPG